MGEEDHTMAEKSVLLTLGGLKKLEQELEYLKTVKRRQVAERIKQAVEFGDINENSEYDDAKNEQAFVEGRILTIERMLRNAEIIDETNFKPDEVGVGSKVKVLDLEFDEELIYTIVGSAEVDSLENKISNESPVGKALLGQKAGDVVEITVPAGQLKYRILGVFR